MINPVDLISGFLAKLRRFNDLGLSDIARLDFTNDEIQSELVTKRSADSLFLGAIPHARVEYYMRRYGIFTALAKIGYTDTRLVIDSSDPFLHEIRIVDQISGLNLFELKVRTSRFEPKEPFFEGANRGPFTMLVVEWIAQQDVLDLRRPARALMPGQKFQGLGILHLVEGLLTIVAKKLTIDGVINHPERYHTALIFRKRKRYFFYSPYKEAEMNALVRDLGRLDMCTASHLIESGRVFDCANDRVFQWQGEEQILPIAKPLRDYFSHGEYARIVEEYSTKLRFEVVGDVAKEGADACAGD
jgi:hypothetical protein